MIRLRMTLPRRQESISTRPLVDKLGVKPGARVAIVDVPDEALAKLVAERTNDVVYGTPLPGTDLVFLAADSIDELGRLAELRERLRPDGAIWVVSRKGKAATLRDVDVIAAAIAVGLVDVKVVSFSATHTAQRLVIPRALRAAHGGSAGRAADRD
jgi:acyl-CoA synthetase (AMP-forming)/AMP-acid ligase II